MVLNFSFQDNSGQIFSADWLRGLKGLLGDEIDVSYCHRTAGPASEQDASA